MGYWLRAHSGSRNNCQIVVSVKEYPNVVRFTYWVHPSNYLEVQDNIYIKKCEVTIKKQPYIMAIKLSGVYWVVWNHTRDFKIPPSSIWNHKYMISDQNCTTRSSITTLSLKSQFEIAEFSQYQYLIDLLAGSLKSGNKNLLHLCICSEIIRVISILNERAARVRFEVTSMN